MLVSPLQATSPTPNPFPNSFVGHSKEFSGTVRAKSYITIPGNRSAKAGSWSPRRKRLCRLVSRTSKFYYTFIITVVPLQVPLSRLSPSNLMPMYVLVIALLWKRRLSPIKIDLIYFGFMATSLSRKMMSISL